MAEFVEIDDAQDPRLDDYRHLTDRQLRHRLEQTRPGSPGYFIAEGPLILEALAERSWPVRSALIAEHRVESLRPILDRLDAPILVAPRPVLDAVGGFPVHRGVLAAGIRPGPRPWLDVVPEAGLLMVAERVNDLENMGSLFRNAAAFGAAAVVLSPGCADPLYRRCLRVSMGHSLRVPFAVANDWPRPLADMRERGWDVLALTPGGDTDLAFLSTPSRAAVLVGAEGPGLSPEALALASTHIRIQMCTDVDSVNVAVAAAIALHQLRRL